MPSGDAGDTAEKQSAKVRRRARLYLWLGPAGALLMAGLLASDPRDLAARPGVGRALELIAPAGGWLLCAGWWLQARRTLRRSDGAEAPNPCGGVGLLLLLFGQVLDHSYRRGHMGAFYGFGALFLLLLLSGLVAWLVSRKAKTAHSR